MGIAELFNTLRKSHRFNDKSSVIREIDEKEMFPDAQTLLFDFNSMIHTVSSKLSSQLLAQLESCFAQGKPPPPPIDLDKLVIAEVLRELTHVESRFPNRKHSVLFIDGIPSYGKIIEQRSRRFIGEMLLQCRKHLLRIYKSDLNVNADDTRGIYWNQYEFEKLATRLRFNKSKISPGTAFMDKLEEALLQKGVILSTYNEAGEGEMKLVQYMRKAPTQSQVVVFSPDADMVLLMLLEVSRSAPNILIFRQNPQGGANHLISVTQMKDIILDICGGSTSEIVDDVVILFTVFGNDFLPGLFNRNSTRQLDVVLDAYIQTRNKLKGRGILINGRRLDWAFLGEVISKCHHGIRSKEKKRFRMPLELAVGTNKNAVKYLQELHDIEYMQGKYTPDAEETMPKTTPEVLLSYCEGLQWVIDYYMNHDTRVNGWYYPYHHAPPLPILSIFLRSKGQALDAMTSPGLEARVFKRYLNPAEQLLYISASDIRALIAPKFLTQSNVSKIGEYTAKHLVDWDALLQYTKGRINVHKILDCSKAKFLSKCRVRVWDPLDLREYLRSFSLEVMTPSHTK